MSISSSIATRPTDLYLKGTLEGGTTSKMSIARKPGKLRNPPRAKQYASYAIVALVLVVAVGGGYYYYQHGGLSTSSTGTGTGGNLTTTTATKAGEGPFALIKTTNGTIEIQLFNASAPKTVANFVNLTNSGFYSNLVWHRIVSGFVIQTGDPNTKNAGGDQTTWGQGTSGKNVPFENDPTLHNTVGTVAMASTGAGTGGSSQFYINLVDNSASLDGKYAVFGQVISGMDVVQTLGKTAVNSNSVPLNPKGAMVLSITLQNSP